MEPRPTPDRHNDDCEQYERLTLERFKIGALHYMTERLSEHGIDCNLDVDIIQDHSFRLDGYVMRIVAMVYGIDRPQIDVVYPKNWWEALKDRFVPQWLRRYIPIHYTRHEVIARQIFPQVKPYPESPIQYTISLIERKSGGDCESCAD